LVNKIGEEKANAVKEKLEKDKIEQMKENNWQKERDKKFIEVAIPKDQLEDQVYYLGFRFRGHGLAQWDEKIGKFLIIAYNFDQPYVEKLEHFADVIDKGFDGFVPLEKIDKNKFYGIRDKRLAPENVEEEINKLK
jgi:hypothetical protein